MPEPNYNCNQCGKAAYQRPSKLMMHKNNFCSKVCHDLFQNKKQEVSCLYCGVSIFRKQCHMFKFPHFFCSNKCRSLHNSCKQEVVCWVCSKSFLKPLNQINIKPRHCCSRECAKLLQKYHKDWGSNRSKLEIELEAVLKKTYNFEMTFNDTRIGYELDVEIPCLGLAFELNGPFHYKPIFGMEKLIQTQKIDREKLQKSIEMNINLIVINVSEDRSSKRVRLQRIQEIIALINSKIQEINYKPEVKQLSMEF